MILDELLDVPLVARLRPAALVVAARLLVEQLLEFLQPPVRQAIEVAALPADGRNDHAVAAADEGHQRGEVERLADLDEIGHALAQGQRHPESIEPCAKESKPVGAVATELRLEVVAQAL